MFGCNSQANFCRIEHRHFVYWWRGSIFGKTPELRQNFFDMGFFPRQNIFDSAWCNFFDSINFDRKISTPKMGVEKILHQFRRNSSSLKQIRRNSSPRKSTFRMQNIFDIRKLSRLSNWEHWIFSTFENTQWSCS